MTAYRRFAKVYPCLIGGSRHRPRLLRVNENGTEIVQIGVSRPRLKQVTEAFEKSRGIVFGKKRGGIEAEFLSTSKRGVINESAGRIVRTSGAAISAVSVTGNCRNPGRPLERLRER